jgi:hypothetical protein
MSIGQTLIFIERSTDIALGAGTVSFPQLKTFTQKNVFGVKYRGEFIVL